jgi:hypothetical protein
LLFASRKLPYLVVNGLQQAEATGIVAGTVVASDLYTGSAQAIPTNWTIVNANVAAAAGIALNKLAALTASRALVSDGSGFIAVSAVTAAELAHVGGVTSAIQTQLNAKASTTHASTHAGAGADAITSLGAHAVTGILTFDNNIALQWKDGGGTARDVLIAAAGNITIGGLGAGEIDLVTKTAGATVATRMQWNTGAALGEAGIDSNEFLYFSGDNSAFSYAGHSGIGADSAGGGNLMLNAATGQTILAKINAVTIATLSATVLNLASGTKFQENAVNISPIGIHDIFIPASAMWPRTTGGCAALAKTEIATSLNNIQTLDFDSATDEFAQFSIVMPRNWNNGTITVTFHWTAAAGSAAETVEWNIQGVANSNDDPLTTAFGTEQAVSDALIATGDVHVTAATSALTIGGTPADSDFVTFQIFRDVSDDNLAADAKLIGVRLHITTDAAVAA